jgi:nitrate reductase assembly molybdenum cofactor insertion protein NarJ
MRRLLSILGWICISWTIASSQVSYLDRPDLLVKVETCLKHTYNFSFREARGIQSELQAATPDHPTPLFLEALIVYWENFPLDPSNKASEEFVQHMDRVIELSKELRNDSSTYTEGVFFDLFGRAFKAMFWADNGKSGKLIPDLGNMYRYTKKGFELKDQFVEFYFSTGLYNYYIEAYPEAHPGYKPILAFMHKGNRELGLEQLHFAINQCVFLKVEAMLFMSLIQLKYENDLNTAAIYAERLVRDYPGNILYQGHLITVLLHQHRYQHVRDLLQETAQQKDRYSEMIRSYADAFLAEMETGEMSRARTAYQETIELAESFGPFADTYRAMGYMGLSRLFEKQGLPKESNTFARKASRLTSYEFILEE